MTTKDVTSICSMVISSITLWYCHARSKLLVISRVDIHSIQQLLHTEFIFVLGDQFVSDEQLISFEPFLLVYS